MFSSILTPSQAYVASRCQYASTKVFVKQRLRLAKTFLTLVLRGIFHQAASLSCSVANSNGHKQDVDFTIKHLQMSNYDSHPHLTQTHRYTMQVPGLPGVPGPGRGTLLLETGCGGVCGPPCLFICATAGFGETGGFGFLTGPPSLLTGAPWSKLSLRGAAVTCGCG